MTAQLLIRIVTAEHFDYLFKDEKNIITTGSVFHPDQIPEFFNTLSRNIPVTLIVPGENILIFEVTLPKLVRSQLLKAIPYALEEQLIEPLEQLHFSISNQRGDGSVTVSVVKKHLLQAWLDQCHSMQLTPRAIFADYFLVPLLENSWHIYLEGDRALLRLNTHQGMAIEQTTLQSLLTLRTTESAANLPNSIVIDYDDGNEHFEPQTISSLPITVTLEPAHTFCMQLFLQGLESRIDLNLLQGEFSPTQKNKKNTLLWRICGGLALLWFIVWVAGLTTQHFIYKSRYHKAQQTVADLYRQVYPAAESIVSPQLRIERSLTTALNIRSGGAFLELLGMVGQQLTHFSDMTIDSLNFRNGTLILSVTAKNFANLAAFTQALQTQGLTVQQQNATSQDNIVTAHLLIGAHHE